MTRLSLIKIPGAGGGGGGTVTGAESGLHMEGTLVRLGGEILESVGIITTDPTRKVIFDGVVALNNGDYSDAYVVINISGEGPGLGINSQNDGITIAAMNNGINISGGVFGINSIGETTGIVAVGNTQNGGDFSGLHGGLNITYGVNTAAGVASDFGVSITAGAVGNKGTPLIMQIPNFSGTLQNFINMSMSTNSVVTNGYGQSIRFSYGQPGGGSSPQAINELRSIWSAVGSLTQTFSIWSPTPGNLTVLTQNFTLYNSGQLQLNKYTAGTFVGATNRILGVTTAGAVIEVLPSAVGPIAGNPTTTIGLTATNGSAATFMRSDAAPALNQAIAPTWTSKHMFTVTNNNAAIELRDAGNIEWRVTAAGTLIGSIYCSNSIPGMTINNQTTGNFGIFSETSFKFLISTAGVVTVDNLSGTGTRMVTASSSGVLSTSTTPIGQQAIVNEATVISSITAAQSGTLFTNEGSSANIQFNLPAAVTGLVYDFANVIGGIDGNIVLSATGSDTIRNGTAISAAGGIATSATQGDACRLVCYITGKWIILFDGTGDWVPT